MSKPNERALVSAAEALERLASDLRSEAEAEEKAYAEDPKYESHAPGLRRRADDLDEVASFLDDYCRQKRP